MIEHIIFDCDGVLIDTEMVAAEIAVSWLHTEQVDITVEQFIREHTGKTFTGIIDQLKTTHKASKILVTFFSPSGYELRKNYKNADYVVYLPLDTKKNAQPVKALAASFISFSV